MRVVCAWCQHESRPSLLREIEPLDDPTETHGICETHHAAIVRQLLAASGGLTPPAPAPEEGPEPGGVLPDLLRLRSWVHAAPSIAAVALARVVEQIERLEARCRTLEAEGAHLTSETAWLRDEVGRLRREHEELVAWHREATWIASTLLDQVLERVLHPLHDVVARLRSVPRPAERGRAPAPSVDRRDESL